MLSVVTALSTGCKIDVLGDDWGPPAQCLPASCGEHARLSVAAPMSVESARTSDLWLDICQGSECVTDVHLEWQCQDSDFFCSLDCTASAEVLGGTVEVKRSSSCGGTSLPEGLCIAIDLPPAAAGTLEIDVTLDDARSGRRIVDGTFELELKKVTVEGCNSSKTCVQGTASGSAPPFDPATAPAGEHSLELASPSASVSAGERHSCGTRVDGTLQCWGNLPGPDGTEIVPAGQFQSVTAGYLQDCTLGLDGIVSCFGNESLAGEALVPPFGVFEQIAVGSNFGCGRRPSGRVECWGDHACNLGSSFATLEVDHIVVSSSDTTLCALLADGTGKCSGGWNELLPDAIQIAVSAEQLCHLTADGSAHCTRDDGGAESSEPGPFVDLVAGSDHACGLASDGVVTCWGTNTLLSEATPAQAFSQISSGTEHVCGITLTGAVACWGRDEEGQSTPPPDFPGG